MIGAVISACVLYASLAQAQIYDAIIIGSGPGGLVAAEYLTRDPSISVLMLEAGGPSLQVTGGNDVPDYAKPKGWTIFDIPGEYNTQWGSQDFQDKYLVNWFASKPWIGRLVGGCSSLNGALYIRTPDAYANATRWPYSAQEVIEGFDELEKMLGSTATPSPDGVQYVQEAYKIVGKAFEASGYSEKELNDADARNSKNRTFGHPPFNIKNGFRDTAAKVFYGAMRSRTNFRLLTFANVTSIKHTKGVAHGVVYVRNNLPVEVGLTQRGLIIMAAGALSTPKILIQSGIGPESQLNLTSQLPDFCGPECQDNWIINNNIGKGLFDTAVIFPTFEHPDMVSYFYDQRPAADIDRYMTQGQIGPFAGTSPVLIGYENHELNGREYEFQTTVAPAGHYPFHTNPKAYSIAAYVNNPVSRDQTVFGEDGMWNTSANNSLYLSDHMDFDAMVWYLNKLTDILVTNGSKRINPPPGADLHEWVRDNGKTAINHFGGSCYTSIDKNDPNRCADEKFKVIGTSNIFVGDASLMKEGTVNPVGFVMYSGYQMGKIAKEILATGPRLPMENVWDLYKDLTAIDGPEAKIAVS